MDVEVNVTSIAIADYLECGNNSMEYEFFSTNGVVRLEISNLPVNKLLYSIATSATGNKLLSVPLL